MRKVFRKVFGRDIISKTAITIALAEHLLHQDTQSYIVDDRVKGKCICGCEVERKFGNTGIGLCILICELCIYCVCCFGLSVMIHSDVCTLHV